MPLLKFLWLPFLALIPGWKFLVLLWLQDKIVLFAVFTKEGWERAYEGECLKTHQQFIGQWMSLLNWISVAMGIFKWILHNINRKHSLNPILVRFRNLFYELCAVSIKEWKCHENDPHKLFKLYLNFKSKHSGWLSLQTNIQSQKLFWKTN